MNRRLFPFFLLILLIFTGCSPSADLPVSSEPTAAVRWTPPELPSAPPVAEAASLVEALNLCRMFVAEMSLAYPDYAPSLSEEDAAYYERHFGNPQADWSGLTSEMTQTIVNLRQQVYLRIESARKMDIPLPDGLEEYVREFESRFFAIGW